MKNKRGQFFLIAAAVIVTIIIGSTTIVNSVKVKDSNEHFYDLSREINFETKQVLDYGVFNDFGDIESLIKGFLFQYANYIRQEQVVFIYGDKNSLNALVFEETMLGSIGLSSGVSTSIEDIVGNVFADVTIQDIDSDSEIDVVTIRINNIDYDFNLREGENFFLVIIKEEDGEKFVAQK